MILAKGVSHLKASCDVISEEGSVVDLPPADFEESPARFHSVTVIKQRYESSLKQILESAHPVSLSNTLHTTHGFAVPRSFFDCDLEVLVLAIHQCCPELFV